MSEKKSKKSLAMWNFYITFDVGQQTQTRRTAVKRKLHSIC